MEKQLQPVFNPLGLIVVKVNPSRKVEPEKRHRGQTPKARPPWSQIVARPGKAKTLVAFKKQTQEDAKVGLKMEEKKKVRRDSKAKLKLAEFKRQMLQVTLGLNVAVEKKVQEAKVGLNMDKDEKKQTEGDLSAKQRVKLVKSKGRKDLENREIEAGIDLVRN